MAQHIFTGSGAPSSAPTAVGQHYIDTTNNVHWVSNGTALVANWRVANGFYVSSAFRTTTNPYVTVGGTTFTRVGDFWFPGTNIFGAPKQIVGFFAESGTGNGNARIQDVTNAQTIASISSITGVTGALYDLGTISNLSAGPAAWELQVSHASAGGSVFASMAAIRY